ncbi:MAG: hypothetical protein AB8B99_06875 [Phormidesmis sp.]
MNVKVSRSLAASFAIAAALALPTAVKAQSNNVTAVAASDSASTEEINSEYSYCVRIPGIGIVCNY